MLFDARAKEETADSFGKLSPVEFDSSEKALVQRNLQYNVPFESGTSAGIKAGVRQARDIYIKKIQLDSANYALLMKAVCREALGCTGTGGSSSRNEVKQLFNGPSKYGEIMNLYYFSTKYRGINTLPLPPGGRSDDSPASPDAPIPDPFFRR
jgi:hypothetical protein